MEDPKSKKLVVVEDTLLGETVIFEADLVVLSCAIVPSQGSVVPLIRCFRLKPIGEMSRPSSERLKVEDGGVMKQI